jgi:2-iminobutanoate/2-iminopropanoate deaminase
MMREIIHSDNAPKAIGPYSQAIRMGKTVYVSGQIPLNPQTGAIPATIEEQVEQVIANIRAILAEGGLGLEAVVKTTIFVTDLGNFETVNRVYGKHFGEILPARATVEVSRLPKDVLVEIEAIAAVE